jgi:hypothetical protein
MQRWRVSSGRRVFLRIKQERKIAGCEMRECGDCMTWRSKRYSIGYGANHATVDPRLADLLCHHRYLKFQLRDYDSCIVTICFMVDYSSSSLVFLLAVVIVPTLIQRKKVQPSNQRLRRNHHHEIATISSAFCQITLEHKVDPTGISISS